MQPLSSTLVLCALLAVATPASIPNSGSVSTSESNGAGAPGRDVVTWNQNQHGKYNLHVSLKDVKIIAVLNSDYYDDDESYEYDYEDLDEILGNGTLATKPPVDELEEEEDVDDKPVAPTTAKPAQANATAATTSKPQNLPPPLLTFISDGKPENISQLPNDPARRTALPRPELYHRLPPTKPPSGKATCEVGYVKDRLGRCRKIRRRRPALFPFKFDFPSFRGFRIARLAPLPRDSSQQDWEKINRTP